jgi:hypothetical protein
MKATGQKSKKIHTITPDKSPLHAWVDRPLTPRENTGTSLDLVGRIDQRDLILDRNQANYEPNIIINFREYKIIMSKHELYQLADIVMNYYKKKWWPLVRRAEVGAR